MKKYGLSDFSAHVVKSVSAESGIMNYAEKSAADLIAMAMATHSRHGIAHIFSGSLAEDIMNHVKKAVRTCSLRK
ncbi:MAG: universal stress protein [Bacteroidetes bacterium]|nr:universal stress protein [Bacteroidota bacterium]